MSQKDLVARVAAQSGQTKQVTGIVIKALGAATQDLLRNGEAVALPGIGLIKRTKRSERTARNPKTGETIRVAEQWVPKFKAAPALKGAC